MTQILKGAHGSPILAVAWHSAGELATACDGGCVAVWDAKRWTVLHAWFSTHPVTCCQFNAHGDLAWGTSCGKVKLRRSPRKSVKEHEDVTLVGHKKALSTLSWRPAPSGPSRRGDLVSGAWDCEVKCWDVRTRTAVTVAGRTREILQVSWSPSGKLIAAASMAPAALLWDPDSRRSPVDLPSPATSTTDAWRPAARCWCNATSWRADSRRLATAWQSGPCVLWDAEQRAPANTLGVPGDAALTCVAWAPPCGCVGQLVATGGEDGVLRVWDERSRDAVREIRGHDGGAGGAGWGDSNLGLLATAGRDGHCRVWDARTWGERAAVACGALGRCGVFAWDSSGRRVAAGGCDGVVRIVVPGAGDEAASADRASP